jgi:outer membrane protein assembly factor BamD
MFERTFAVLLLSIAVLTTGACSVRGAVNPERLDAPQLYAEAQRSMEIGNYATAVAMMEQLERRYSFSLEAQQAQLEIIFAHYKNGNYEEAEAAADRFLEEQPRHPDMDYAHYLRGLIFFDRNTGYFDRLLNIDPARRDMTYAENSYRAFQILVTSFPESSYVPDARQRMIYLRNQIARHEIHVARYYMTLGAWVAAATRARGVVEQFEETPSVVDGLVILHNAYRQLQLDELADDVAVILANNYPNARGRLNR